MEIKNEPKLDWIKVAGGGLIHIGFLLLLSVVHILAINTIGGTHDVLTGLRIILIYIFIASIIICFAAIIIHLLRWLTWSISTPEWQKGKQKKGFF